LKGILKKLVELEEIRRRLSAFFTTLMEIVNAMTSSSFKEITLLGARRRIYMLYILFLSIVKSPISVEDNYNYSF
jgi:hypothetical protein